MGSRHQPSNLPGLFPGQGYPQAEMAFQESKNSHQLDHIMINRTCRRSLQDMYVFGEVRSLLSLAFCCFEAQAQKDWEATSQTSKVRYREAETT